MLRVFTCFWMQVNLKGHTGENIWSHQWTKRVLSLPEVLLRCKWYTWLDHSDMRHEGSDAYMGQGQNQFSSGSSGGHCCLWSRWALRVMSGQFLSVAQIQMSSVLKLTFVNPAATVFSAFSHSRGRRLCISPHCRSASTVSSTAATPHPTCTEGDEGWAGRKKGWDFVGNERPLLIL